MSFGAIAADYDRLRPPPAAAAVDWLLAGPGPRRTVVDLAAGTGLLSRALAASGAAVIAVEPDERMRAVLAARSPGVEVRDGRGEAIPLPDASADAVYVSSAWHWMDAGRALAEIARVLRDGGRFGAIWTGADPQVPWLREVRALRDGQRLCRQEPASPAGDGAAQDSSGQVGSGLDGGAQDGAVLADGRPGVPAASRRARVREVTLPGGAPFSAARTASFGYLRRMSPGDVAAMFATYSGVITADPAERAAVLGEIREAVAGLFPGAAEIEVPMRSCTWQAGRLPRA